MQNSGVWVGPTCPHPQAPPTDTLGAGGQALPVRNAQVQVLHSYHTLSLLKDI